MRFNISIENEEPEVLEYNVARRTDGQIPENDTSLWHLLFEVPTI